MPAAAATRYAQAGRMFALDVKGMEMTVVHDDGLYRHLRFRRPDTSLYWFDLVTWPNCLCFTGDVGTWVFSRVMDMIDFFSAASGLDINPGYWAEKVREDGTDLIRRYDEDTARACVTEAFREHADEYGWVWSSTARLWAEIDDDVLSEIGDESSFRAAVADFAWRDGVEDFRFHDAWEWDCRSFRPQFLWACFAVQWGVNRYRAHLIETADPTAVVVTATTARPPVPRRAAPARFREIHSERHGEVVATPKEQYL